MFCNHCGAQNYDGATFCGKCGNPISSQAAPMVPNGYQQRAQSRDSELNEAERMLAYFSQVADAYAEYDRVSVMVARCARGKYHALLVWGILVEILGMFYGILFLTSYSGMPAAKVFLFLLCILPGVGMILGYGLYARNFNNNTEKYNQRFLELSERLFSHYQNYGTCTIGAEYTNPVNLAMIRDTIRSGRADTIKEAIRVLEEDAYRSNTQRYAAQTMRYTQAVACNTNASAVFNAAGFFMKR